MYGKHALFGPGTEDPGRPRGGREFYRFDNMAGRDIRTLRNNADSFACIAVPSVCR